jgi:hypothetical protein
MLSNRLSLHHGFQYQFHRQGDYAMGGMVLLRQMLDETGLKKAVLDNKDLPVPGSNRGYAPSTTIESSEPTALCTLRLHAMIRFWDAFSAGREYRRSMFSSVFFRNFTQGMNNLIANYFYAWMFERIQFDNFILDCDSTVMTRYGEQEGVKKGYNPQKKGQKSHHPLIAFTWRHKNDSQHVAALGQYRFIRRLPALSGKYDGETQGQNHQSCPAGQWVPQQVDHGLSGE